MDETISIIVPTYNCEEFVNECLDSVLSQRFEGCELVVVDDGSSDGTRKRLESCGGMENVKMAFCDHRGASAARNVGLEMASGKYVGFLDCDDRIHEDFFGKTQGLLTKDADLYIFGIERIFLDGSSEIWKVNDDEYASVSDFADKYIRIGRMLIYSNCNKLYRKSIIERADIRFDEELFFGEDRLFNFAYLKACEGLGNGTVVTSASLMLKYIQRRSQSMSSRFIPEYDKLLMQLHRAKTDCFFDLSKGTSREEKEIFEKKDLANTMESIREHKAAFDEI